MFALWFPGMSINVFIVLGVCGLYCVALFVFWSDCFQRRANEAAVSRLTDSSDIANKAINRPLWVAWYLETWCCCLCSHVTQLWAGLREHCCSSKGRSRWGCSTGIFQLNNIDVGAVVPPSDLYIQNNRGFFTNNRVPILTCNYRDGSGRPMPWGYIIRPSARYVEGLDKRCCIFLPDSCTSTPYSGSSSYHGCGRRVYSHSTFSPTPPLIFTGVIKCEIWPRASTPFFLEPPNKQRIKAKIHVFHAAMMETCSLH